MTAAWVVVAALLAAQNAQNSTGSQRSARHRSSQVRGDTSAGGVSGESAVHGEPAGRSGRSGPEGPGLEFGGADGMAGGRTDRGPKGAVGIADDHTSVEDSRQRANDAAAANPQHLPQRADVDGMGDLHHGLNYAQPLREEGARIPAPSRGSRALGHTAQPGGAAAQGTAGHTGIRSDPGPTPN